MEWVSVLFDQKYHGKDALLEEAVLFVHRNIEVYHLREPL